MSVSSHTLIAREGFPIIMAAAVIAGVMSLAYGIWASILWLPVVVLTWLFRDPLRRVPSCPLGLLSPVEGNIKISEGHPDPYLGRDAWLIRIAMPITAVYSVRGIIEGKLKQQWLDQESEDEHDVAHALHIQTDGGDDVIIVLRPGRYFKRLSCEVSIGERVGQGHRCGMIMFGADVDIYLPPDANVKVQSGDKVVGGETILAELLHRR